MSRDRIRQLTVAHQSLLASLDQIQPLLRSYSQAKPKLRDFQLKVLAHVGFQNNDFYAPLFTFFDGERQDLKMLESLQTDLKNVKIETLVFFERHSGEMDDHHSRNFPKDFTDFTKLWVGRIQLEENFLFPLLEKFEN